jgi:hypothetical protein
LEECPATPPEYLSIKIVCPNLACFERKGNGEWCVAWSLLNQTVWVLIAFCFGEIVAYLQHDHFTHPTLLHRIMNRRFAKIVGCVQRAVVKIAYWSRSQFAPTQPLLPNSTARETHHAPPKVSSIKIVGQNLVRFECKAIAAWCVAWSLFYQTA